MVRDRMNREAHQHSAQQACEAASAVRTVASLGRERDVLRMYAKLLDEPERVALRSAVLSNAVYGFSQAMIFFVLPLIFWSVAAVQRTPLTLAGTARARSLTKT